MPKLIRADFYYGAVLANLINRHINPALIEGDNRRRVYNFTTNKNDFRLFVKYRRAPSSVNPDGHRSWQFVFSPSEIQELTENCKQEKGIFTLCLVCGDVDIKKSQYAVLDQENIKKLLDWRKSSITLSLRRGEHAFRLSVGGGRSNAMQIPTNRSC